MTSDQLATYLAAAKAAKSRAVNVPYPWTRRPGSLRIRTPLCYISQVGYIGGASVNAQDRFRQCQLAIADLIEHCPDDIPTLADAVVELAAEVERLNEQLQQRRSDDWEAGTYK